MTRSLMVAMLLMLLSGISVANYFNTHRTHKIIGSYITNQSQIHEISSFSNAFSFTPQFAEEITRYLDENKGKLLPVISIGRLLFDEATGLYHHDVGAIIQAIEKSKHIAGEILFLMDEPLWWIRDACTKKGKLEACLDIKNNYVETLSTFRTVGQLLRKQFPGSGIMHIEAWAELAIQKKERPDDQVIMLDDAEYLGFDCYGDINSCGSAEYGFHSQLEYGTWVWNAMLAMEAQQAIGRKLFVIPGTFIAPDHFEELDSLLYQMEFYAWILGQSERIGGFGAFLWGDMIENNKPFTGGRNIFQVTNFLKFIARYYGIAE